MVKGSMVSIQPDAKSRIRQRAAVYRRVYRDTEAVIGSAGIKREKRQRESQNEIQKKFYTKIHTENYAGMQPDVQGAGESGGKELIGNEVIRKKLQREDAAGKENIQKKIIRKKVFSKAPVGTERIRKCIKNGIAILAGVLATGCVAFTISEFETGSRSKVYAVDSKSGKGGYASEFQAGLMGVVNGVADMQYYSDAVRLCQVAGREGEILAGASAVHRQAIHQTSIEKGVSKAAELGYYSWQALEESQMNEDEYYTLLQIVEAEATGGDVTSKMMVAGVVLNRVRDSRFPDSIIDVVWQTVGGNAQFQPTQDGRIYSCEITDSTIEAVDRVLAGEDYSQGALFFFAPDSSEADNVQWFETSLSYLFEYGGHEYYTFHE